MCYKGVCCATEAGGVWRCCRMLSRCSVSRVEDEAIYRRERSRMRTHDWTTRLLSSSGRTQSLRSGETT